MIRMLEVMERHGPNLGAPHTKSMGDGLFEIRAKAKEGIGRGLFCYVDGRCIHVLVVFVKKSQKTPGNVLSLARSRMREVTGHE